MYENLNEVMIKSLQNKFCKMKANELRIGNILHAVIKYIVIGIDEEFITAIPLDKDMPLLKTKDSIDKFSPIPLTKEWLDKLGFVKYSDNNPDGGIHYRLGVFSIGVWDNGKDIRFTNIIDGRRLKYVHKLQNMYFELEGEELNY